MVFRVLPLLVIGMMQSGGVEGLRKARTRAHLVSNHSDNRPEWKPLVNMVTGIKALNPSSGKPAVDLKDVLGVASAGLAKVIASGEWSVDNIVAIAIEVGVTVATKVATMVNPLLGMAVSFLAGIFMGGFGEESSLVEDLIKHMHLLIDQAVLKQNQDTVEREIGSILGRVAGCCQVTGGTLLYSQLRGIISDIHGAVSTLSWRCNQVHLLDNKECREEQHRLDSFQRLYYVLTVAEIEMQLWMQILTLDIKDPDFSRENVLVAMRDNSVKWHLIMKTHLRYYREWRHSQLKVEYNCSLQKRGRGKGGCRWLMAKDLALNKDIFSGGGQYSCKHVGYVGWQMSNKPGLKEREVREEFWDEELNCKKRARDAIDQEIDDVVGKPLLAFAKVVDAAERAVNPPPRPTCVALETHFNKWWRAWPNDWPAWERPVGLLDGLGAAVGDWEAWEVVYGTGSLEGKVAFRSVHGFYLSATDSGALSANSAAQTSAEHFQLEQQGEKWAVKSSYGYYVAALRDGTLVANRDKVGPWELFRNSPVGTCFGKDFDSTPRRRAPAPTPPRDDYCWDEWDDEADEPC